MSFFKAEGMTFVDGLDAFKERDEMSLEVLFTGEFSGHYLPVGHEMIADLYLQHLYNGGYLQRKNLTSQIE